MDLKDIKELMNAMRRTATKRVAIKNKDFELELEREGNDVHKILEPLMESRDNRDELRASQAFSRAGHMPTPHHSPTEPAAAVEKNVEDSVNVVTSPMVGTFFSSPSPDDPPFVRVGDKIEKDSVVCIIEAMKVMNEVKAGVSGVVEEVLVENGHPVEFGTKLFRVK